jgi:CheY-like chemotaxis protein
MQGTILVVEDDFDTRYPLAELLRLRGYLVTTASDADKAFTAACRQRPDLIITDIVLPGRSGLHFIQRVRASESLRPVPILVISGCGQAMLGRALSVGADHCLEKPIRLEQLWEALARLFAKGDQDESVESDSGRAAGIEELIEQFRVTSSQDEREALLARLKKNLLDDSDTTS